MDNKGCIKCGSTEAGQKEIATTYGIIKAV